MDQRNGGQAIEIPRQTIEKLKGKTFKYWDEFRNSIWEEISKDKVLGNKIKSYLETFLDSSGIKRNFTNLKNGRALEVKPSQEIIKIKFNSNTLKRKSRLSTYEIHHKTPINKGGLVYDFDNLIILSPKIHKGVLSDKYHRQKEK